MKCGRCGQEFQGEHCFHCGAFRDAKQVVKQARRDLGNIPCPGTEPTYGQVWRSEDQSQRVQFPDQIKPGEPPVRRNYEMSRELTQMLFGYRVRPQPRFSPTTVAPGKFPHPAPSPQFPTLPGQRLGQVPGQLTEQPPQPFDPNLLDEL